MVKDLLSDAGLEEEPSRHVWSKRVPFQLRYTDARAFRQGSGSPRLQRYRDATEQFPRCVAARLEARPEDVARLLLADFALIYGDDWLFVPIDLVAGTVFRISLSVRDTFGVVTSVPPSVSSDAPAERWGFWA